MGLMVVQNCCAVSYLIVMMRRMAHSSSHDFDTAKGYEREISSREVALFGALLLLPVALLLILSVVAD
jgi:hypothetical protein